ncbi:MAG: fumarylacetoacetate hydrolase family protein [Syntrophorhabdus sp.]|nr:fumarylacetoacetate hydrolase family protein [Syntrophorhabdus sp.]MDI9558667.1 fumarylacetoacetate hydrolase family protein [Pseudomonadota bacterium]OPX96569.1 MAG: Ureidoglycolate lyase [Syntrophorhabdus sp. PtaB.Bin027]OQB76082.1 MAG: Ureidoglycolate lyase [Deltaproteobacteria bacterium ADurb.Bin135]MBP8744174.1 fumarylacetoacetate hydrolase family protein [Syntrophorhabdus sp.]
MFHPTKIIAIGLNYLDHAREFNMELPAYPLIFMKPQTAVIGNAETIIYPPQTKELHYEGELAIVIGKKTRNVTVENAEHYIAGYTCANDITARDLQRMDGQWTRSKSFDTFCPLGPKIAKNIDPTNLAIATRVNGITKQKSNTNQMIFNVFQLVSFISGIMTLMPGDIIITGTPSGVGELQAGDTVEVEIEEIGILKNTVMRLA